MQRTIVTLFSVVVLGLVSPELSGGVYAVTAQSNGMPPPVSVGVPTGPTSFKGSDGRTHLVYELHLINFRPAEVTLTRVEVFSGSGSKPLVSYSDKELYARLGRPGYPPNYTDKQVIGGGALAVIFMWLTADASAVPARLYHKLYFKAGGNAGDVAEQIIEGGEIKVRKTGAVVIGPPARGGMWVAVNGPSNDSGHRRSLRPVDGKARIAQRFAYDWIRLNEEGQPAKGGGAKNEDWYGYGTELLAVAAGTVSEVKDGIPENVPNSSTMAVPITLETIAGNHVILDLGNGHFALYAHLKPGSLRVKVGDRVRRGQVLGLLGNSGNSSAPHLHFHIGDADSPLGAEGLPYLFDSFELLGEASPSLASGSGSFKPESPVARRRKQMPLVNTVVRFP